MSEYVVKVHEKRKMTDFPNDPLAYLLSLPVLEEVVRCRDCSWFHENATLEDRDYPHFCHQHGIDLEDGNGFCKWGERND